MSKFKGLVNLVTDKALENSPELLIGMGLAGMLTSTVLACKATIKVNEIIEKEKEIRHLECESELELKEKISLGYKPYIPAALGYCVSAACILGANSINNKRNATLLTAYKIGERALIEYREQVIEHVGEEGEMEIRDKVAKKRMEQDPPTNIIMTGKGETLCYDTISGRYFKCDAGKINRALNDINYRMIHDMYVCVNDLYELIGLEYIPAGYTMGWNIENGQLEIQFSAQVTEDQQVCLVLNYNNHPIHDYDRLR